MESVGQRGDGRDLVNAPLRDAGAHLARAIAFASAARADFSEADIAVAHRRAQAALTALRIAEAMLAGELFLIGGTP